MTFLSDDCTFERPSNQYFLGQFQKLEASVKQYNHVPLRIFVDGCVATVAPDVNTPPSYYFFIYLFFLIFFTHHNTISIQDKQNNRRILPIPKVQSKGRGKKIKKIIPLYNHVY